MPPSALVGGARGAYFATPALDGDAVLTAHRPGDRFLLAVWRDRTRALAYGWYSVRWEATLQPPADGALRLGVDANGGYRLFVDDTLRIDRWEQRTTAPELVTLRASRAKPRRIRLEYAQSSGEGRGSPGVGRGDGP